MALTLCIEIWLLYTLWEFIHNPHVGLYLWSVSVSQFTLLAPVVHKLSWNRKWNSVITLLIHLVVLLRSIKILPSHKLRNFRRSATTQGFRILHYKAVVSLLPQKSAWSPSCFVKRNVLKHNGGVVSRFSMFIQNLMKIRQFIRKLLAGDRHSVCYHKVGFRNTMNSGKYGKNQLVNPEYVQRLLSFSILCLHVSIACATWRGWRRPNSLRVSRGARTERKLVCCSTYGEVDK
jgi:hypothetical protein